VPRERPIAGSPADWLARARSDLALARMPLPKEAFYEDLCFHAQQAAEKAIKAVYRALQREFPYTHDLAELLKGLEKEGVAIPETVHEAVELSDFAWHGRYPGTAEPVTAEEHRRALALAELAVRWAEDLVRGGTS